MRGTLSISNSGVRLRVCSTMTPLKSQLTLGTHFMADGQVTNGFVSALWNVDDDDEELWNIEIVVIVVVVNVVDFVVNVFVAKKAFVSSYVIKAHTKREILFPPHATLSHFFIARLLSQDPFLLRV